MRRYDLLDPMHLYLDRVMGADADSIWMQVQKKGERTQTLKPSATKVQRLQGRLSFPSY